MAMKLHGFRKFPPINSNPIFITFTFLTIINEIKNNNIDIEHGFKPFINPAKKTPKIL